MAGRAHLSLAFTTYQSGKLFFIGWAGRQAQEDERTSNRCMGLTGDSQSLCMSSLYQLWRFENALAPGELHQGCDRFFVRAMPRNNNANSNFWRRRGNSNKA